MAPWTAFWQRNIFAQGEVLGPLLANPFLRGAVSGVGLITAIAGLAELAGAFRRDDRSAPDRPASS